MEISFDTKSLREFCESETKSINILGVQKSLILKHRLADLRAATCVNDLIVGNPRIVIRENEQQYVLDIFNDFSLFFCANHNNNPLNNDDSINWSKVSRIKIIKIGSNYE